MARPIITRVSRPTSAGTLRHKTVLGEVAYVVRQVVAQHEARAWPSPRWQSDPVGFARTILGVDLSPFQIEMLEAVRDHKRVAISGGRKIGKDFSLGVGALWWYSSFDGARVRLLATTAAQIDDVLWREIRMLVAGSGRCLQCKKDLPGGPTPCPHSAVISGHQGELARTGLKSEDFREIVGRTARDPEAIAGTSGRNLLYLIDEASAVDDALHISVRGNLASGNGREVLISNPTQSSGFFHRAFHESREFYKCLTFSTEQIPNVVEGREVFPGQASREWVEEQKRDFSERDYTIHVRGEFVAGEEGSVISIHQIVEAIKRWPETPSEGRLVIGLDPAGPSGTGDESVYCLRRGKKLVEIFARRGLSAEAHLVHLLDLIHKHRRPSDVGDERPVVVCDRDGDVGARVWGELRSYQQGHADAFELVGVRGGERARRKPMTYDRTRDEVYAVLSDWFREGGSIPDDPRLRAELGLFQWVDLVSGRNKVTPKDVLRDKLGRSPDRADALALSTWYAPRWRPATAAVAERPRDIYEAVQQGGIDVYASTWEPYGG